MYTDLNIALSDTQIDSIQCLNFAQNWFNSIFDSKSFHENSIQKIIQFLIIFVIQFSILFNSKWVILIQFNRLFNLKWKIIQFSHKIWILTNFRVFLAILRPNLSIFAKFNSKMGSFVLFSTKFNSNIYSFFCFATNSIQKLIQFSFFNKIQFKSWFNSLVSNKIQFKNIFKMLKLAVFNSIKYSFNMKTWVSDRAQVGH